MYTYLVNIDWLSLYCVCGAECYHQSGRIDVDPATAASGTDGEQVAKMVRTQRFPESPSYQYEIMPYGSRQYAQIIYAYRSKEKIAEIQACPHSHLLLHSSCIVKFDNRLLYHAHGRGMISEFLREHSLRVERVSRVDLCADFTKFYCYECVPFIRDFLSSKIRHIGRGAGQANFTHGSYMDKDDHTSKAFLRYGSMTFGKHSSDVRVYLYNKSRELAEVHDKPYIRDAWAAAGLTAGDSKDVWRLEVSIHGQGIRYTNKDTNTAEEITFQDLMDDSRVLTIYRTFVDAYFRFIRNRDGITNITREGRKAALSLFGDNPPTINRGYLRCVTGSNRADRIFIKKLHQHADELRALDTPEWHLFGYSAAQKVAAACDLSDWLEEKAAEWERLKHK